MQTAHKSALIALLAALVISSASADCSAPIDGAELPYSVKYTTTGDDKSTTFILTACSNKCTAGTANCLPLKGLSVGASNVGTTPASSKDACGSSFTGSALGSLSSQSPSEPSHCKDFYLVANKAGAALEDVCPNGCPVVYTLANGVKASGSVTGGSAITSPTPTPATASPSTAKPTTGTTSPSKNSPTSYGRRRILSVEQQQDGVSGFGARSLQQYGRRRLTQYGRKF